MSAGLVRAFRAGPPERCLACPLFRHVQELPGMAGQMKASVREGLRQGVAGAVRDLQVGLRCASLAATKHVCSA